MLGIEQLVGGMDQQVALESRQAQAVVQVGLDLELPHSPAQPAVP
ncbi:MAG: hypothetical protein ACOC84_01215 [Actinomycetota bacterium]